MTDVRPKLLSVRQAATELSCSRDHIYDLIAAGPDRGGLPAVDIGNKAQLLRVPAEALDEFIAARTKTVPLAS